MTKLSDKQMGFLRTVARSEAPTDDFPNGVPFYLSYTHMEFQFNTAGERERWYQNLETRGLITRTGSGKCFVRLTENGRVAIAARASQSKGDSHGR